MLFSKSCWVHIFLFGFWLLGNTMCAFQWFLGNKLKEIKVLIGTRTELYFYYMIFTCIRLTKTCKSQLAVIQWYHMTAAKSGYACSHLAWKMSSAQALETLGTYNSAFQDLTHPDNEIVSKFVYLDWKRSSGWLESWEGLLLVTDVSTSLYMAIIPVCWQVCMVIIPAT